MAELAGGRTERPRATTLAWCLVAGMVGGALASVALQAWRSQREQATLAPPAPATAGSAPTVALSAEARQRAAVLKRLSDPDSAQFQEVRRSNINPLFWCGQVNARNRMGGMVGFTRYVVELQDSPQFAQFDSLLIDPADSSAGDQSVRFAAYWNGYCQ